MTDGTTERTTTGTLRVADVLVPLSLATDLGMGLADDHATRSCLLATELARRVGVPEADVAVIYYTTLLEHLGCTATAREEAAHVGGDQIATRSLISRTDFARPGEMVSLLRSVGAGRGAVGRTRTVVGVIDGFRWGPGVQAAICEVASMLAARLGMPEAVQTALGQVFERWDGKGEPRRLKGEAIGLPARVAMLASRAETLHTAGGAAAALEGVGGSAGGWFDPELAAAFDQHGPELLEELATLDPVPAVIAAEPEPRLEIGLDALDGAARAFADMVDLLSPYTLGHSTGVAALAEAAAGALGLSVAECVTLRRAALLHDLGRVGVPSGTWEKSGPLTSAEWERVRLHPYYTERILARSGPLQAAAAIAGMHHERCDGSGYHRGAAAREMPLAARILAAADAYQAMLQDRPHRVAFTTEVAADRLAEEARAGRLDAEAVEALLGTTGDARRIGPRARPAGLSEREVEVLRLVATGASNREIADALVISRRTAEHHVQHVYAKIGVSTRPGATLFALEHDLLTG